MFLQTWRKSPANSLWSTGDYFNLCLPRLWYLAVMALSTPVLQKKWPKIKTFWDIPVKNSSFPKLFFSRCVSQNKRFFRKFGTGLHIFSQNILIALSSNLTLKILVWHWPKYQKSLVEKSTCVIFLKKSPVVFSRILSDIKALKTACWRGRWIG